MERLLDLTPYLLLGVAVISLVGATAAFTRSWLWPLARRVGALFVLAEAQLNPINGDGLISRIDGHGKTLEVIQTNLTDVSERMTEHIGIAKAQDGKLAQLTEQVSQLDRSSG